MSCSSRRRKIARLHNRARPPSPPPPPRPLGQSKVTRTLRFDGTDDDGAVMSVNCVFIHAGSIFKFPATPHATRWPATDRHRRNTQQRTSAHRTGNGEWNEGVSGSDADLRKTLIFILGQFSSIEDHLPKITARQLIKHSHPPYTTLPQLM